MVYLMLNPNPEMELEQLSATNKYTIDADPGMP